MRTSRRTHIVAACVLAGSVGCVFVAACSSQDPDAIRFAPGRGPTGPETTATATTPAATTPAPTATTPPAPVVEAGAPDAPADATLTTDADASPDDAGDEGGAEAAAAGLAVISFTLLDTDITNVINGSPVQGEDPILNDSSFSLGTVGADLSIRANLGATAPGSVGFVIDQTDHTEDSAPYTLCGDDGMGTITNCNLTAGKHTLTATPWSEADLAGTPGTPLTITFTIDP